MWRITWRDLADKKWSLVAYLVASAGLLWTYVATFNSSVASTQQLQELIKTYPKALVEAIGLNNLSMNTIESYLNMKHFSLIWPLMAIFLALSRAGGQVAGEVRAGTMGLLLSLPLQRWRIVVAKYLSGLITVVLFTGVSVFGVIPLAAAYNIPTHLHTLLGMWLLTTLFMWAIYGVAFAVSAFSSEKGRVYAITGSALLLSYVMNIVALINDQWAGLKYYSIFYYFDTQKVLGGEWVSGESTTVFTVIIAVSLVFAIWRFNKRDAAV